MCDDPENYDPEEPEQTNEAKDPEDDNTEIDSGLNARTKQTTKKAAKVAEKAAKKAARKDKKAKKINAVKPDDILLLNNP